MAKIQKFISSGERKQSNISIPESGFRQTTGKSGLRDIAAGLSSIAKSHASSLAISRKANEKIQKGMEQAEQASQLSSAKVSMIRFFSDKKKEYEGRDDYPNFNDRTEFVAKYREELFNGITHDPVKNIIAPIFEKNASIFDADIASLGRSKWVDSDKAAVKTETDNLVHVSTGMPREKIMFEVLPLLTSGVEGRVQSGVLKPVDGDKLIQDTASRIWDIHIENRIETNPGQIKIELEDKNNFPGLTPEKREGWIDVTDTKIKQVVKDAEKFIVRDVYDAVVTRYPDSDEAIAFMLKPGNAKKLGITSGQVNSVVSIIKDNRAEIKLAADNKKSVLESEKKAEEDQAKKQKELVANTIASDIYEFEKSGDFEGRLNYIDALPENLGKEKQKLLNDYNKDLKESKKDTPKTDVISFSDAQTDIEDSIAKGRPLEDSQILLKYGDVLNITEKKSIVKYNRDSKKTHIAKSVVAQKTRINDVFNRGDFGTDKEKYIPLKSDVLIGLNEWVMDNPKKDPQEYVDSKLDLIAKEEMANKLWSSWEWLVPGRGTTVQRKKDIAKFDDTELAKEFIKDKGYSTEDFTDDEIKSISNTVEFNRYKTGLLRD